MKLGFLTSCMPERSLEEIAVWAGANGYEALELAAWPQLGDRPCSTASHVKADAFDEAEATAFAARRPWSRPLGARLLRQQPRPRSPQGRQPTQHLRRCIDAAGGPGSGWSARSSARDLTRSVADNRRVAERVLPPLVDHAVARGVRLMIENCVMEGWHPDGYPGNLAYSPELWEWMFELGLYLNYDPSHLLWLGIDPVAALKPYVDRVAHAHAKDAETFAAERQPLRVFGALTREDDPWDMGWWRYRIPGLGEVDFRRYVDTLYEGGFDGVLSVEHEDPVWGGTPELVEAGLTIARNTLRGLVVGDEERPRGRDLVKEYPGVKALQGVDLDVREAEVHCLLGPNGAGKSTLIKCVSGAVEPTSGEILFDGEPLPSGDPAGSLKRGVATIYQELDLVEDLSVAESIFLAHEPRRRGGLLLDLDEMYRDSAALLERLGHEAIPPRAKVGALRPAAQQIVSIARGAVGRRRAC